MGPPELHRLLDQLRAGDTLVVWKRDRLSRSLKDLLTILERVDRTGAKFRSLTEAIDTSGPAGRQKKEIVEAVASGRKTSAEIARLFKIHPATVSRLLAGARRCVSRAP